MQKIQISRVLIFFLILKNNYFRLCAIFSKKNVYSDFMYQSLLIPDNFYFIYYNLYTLGKKHACLKEIGMVHIKWFFINSYKFHKVWKFIIFLENWKKILLYFPKKIFFALSYCHYIVTILSRQYCDNGCHDNIVTMSKQWTV